MTYFTASFETIILRLYLLMAVVIIPFLIGAPILSLIALPIFLSCMLGISIKNGETPKNNNTSKLNLETNARLSQPKAA